jgi:hypothetical protein
MAIIEALFVHVNMLDTVHMHILCTLFHKLSVLFFVNTWLFILIYDILYMKSLLSDTCTIHVHVHVHVKLYVLYSTNVNVVCHVAMICILFAC